MFKRVEKRRRRQAEEEELGINDELKQVLGIQDTDSEESDSDSDDGGSEGSGDDGGNEGNFPDMQFEGSDAEYDDDDTVDDHDSKSLPSFLVKLTIEQALKEPIIPAPDHPNLSFCVLCPLKTLRSETMVQAHKRRLAQFIKHSEGVDPTEEALSLIEEKMQAAEPTFVKHPATEGKSKRTLKKEATRAIRKANREKSKLKRRAAGKSKDGAKSKVVPEAPKLSRKQRRQGFPDTSAAILTTSNAPVVASPGTTKASLPPPKKRRVQEESDAPRKSSSKTAVEKLKPVAGESPSSKPPPTPGPPLPSIKNIARSASHRARVALSQSRKAKP